MEPTNALSQPITRPAPPQRSTSDSAPVLSPSPRLKERYSDATKDDNVLITKPSRPSALLNGHAKRFALQASNPSEHAINSDSSSSSGQSPYSSAWPESRESFTSPSSVLPRHSRGMDFSRACTNLHHSTIPESTPESSPTISNKHIRPLSRRGSAMSISMDSPRQSWSSTWLNGGLGDRIGIHSRAIPPAVATSSDASSSDSDEDETLMRQDDPDEMITTPQVNKMENVTSTTPYGLRNGSSLGAWTESQSPIARGVSKFRRHRLRKAPVRPFGSSGLGNALARFNPSSAQSSNDLSQSHTVPMQSPVSRRGSLLVGTDDLHISTSNESGDEGSFKFQSPQAGVVRRPVVRRSNLLPKTKGFARIRAQLQEEHTPVDSEVKKEAEVVRQVRDKDVGIGQNGQDQERSSSPDLTPNIPTHVHTEPTETSDAESQDATSGEAPKRRPLPHGQNSSNVKLFLPHLFTGHNSNNNNNNNNSQKSRATRTGTSPPRLAPPLFHRPRSSSLISDDAPMDSPTTLTTTTTLSSTIAPQEHPSLPLPDPTPLAIDVPRKNANQPTTKKRCRDDSFDPAAASTKRRAVSPGMSVASSPVLGQSPVNSSGGGGWWLREREQQRGEWGKAARENSMTSTSAASASDGVSQVSGGGWERSGSVSTTGGGWWGNTPVTGNGSVGPGAGGVGGGSASERSSIAGPVSAGATTPSSGSVAAGGGGGAAAAAAWRGKGTTGGLGMQGYENANDGFMKMTLE